MQNYKDPVLSNQLQFYQKKKEIAMDKSERFMAKGFKTCDRASEWSEG